MKKLAITFILLTANTSTSLAAEIRGSHSFWRLGTGTLTTLVDIELRPKSRYVYFHREEYSGGGKVVISYIAPSKAPVCYLELKEPTGPDGAIIRKGKTLVIKEGIAHPANTESVGFKLKGDNIPYLYCYNYNGSPARYITIDQFLGVFEGVFDLRDLSEIEPERIEP